MKISARVVACTTWQNAPVRSTLECVYPKFLQAELNTHGLLSRSAMSSRAVPLTRVIAQVENAPYIPRRFGLAEKGMQPSEYVEEGSDDYESAKRAWLSARDAAVSSVKLLMSEVNVHKQHVNRLLEPFMWTVGVVTAEQWSNFFALRLPLMPHETAEIAPLVGAMTDMSDLALAMYTALEQAVPVRSWLHIPYVSEVDPVSVEEVDVRALMDVSAMRCARVSFRPHEDGSTSLAEDAAKARKLVSDGHWGPFQHPAVARYHRKCERFSCEVEPSDWRWHWQRARECGESDMRDFSRLRPLPVNRNMNIGKEDG